MTPTTRYFIDPKDLSYAHEMLVEALNFEPPEDVEVAPAPSNDVEDVVPFEGFVWQPEPEPEPPKPSQVKVGASHPDLREYLEAVERIRGRPGFGFFETFRIGAGANAAQWYWDRIPKAARPEGGMTADISSRLGIPVTKIRAAVRVWDEVLVLYRAALGPWHTGTVEEKTASAKRMMRLSKVYEDSPTHAEGIEEVRRVLATMATPVVEEVPASDVRAVQEPEHAPNDAAPPSVAEPTPEPPKPPKRAPRRTAAQMRRDARAYADLLEERFPGGCSPADLNRAAGITSKTTGQRLQKWAEEEGWLRSIGAGNGPHDVFLLTPDPTFKPSVMYDAFGEVVELLTDLAGRLAAPYLKRLYDSFGELRHGLARRSPPAPVHRPGPVTIASAIERLMAWVESFFVGLHPRLHQVHVQPGLGRLKHLMWTAWTKCQPKKAKPKARGPRKARSSWSSGISVGEILTRLGATTIDGARKILRQRMFDIHPDRHGGVVSDAMKAAFLEASSWMEALKRAS
jgi:hypothetical protein